MWLGPCWSKEMNPPAKLGRKPPRWVVFHLGPFRSRPVEELNDPTGGVAMRFLSVTESNRVHEQLRPTTVDAGVAAPAVGAGASARAVGCGRRGVPGCVH